MLAELEASDAGIPAGRGEGRVDGTQACQAAWAETKSDVCNQLVVYSHHRERTEPWTLCAARDRRGAVSQVACWQHGGQQK